MVRNTIYWTAVAITLVTFFWFISGRITQSRRMSDLDIWNRADLEYRTNKIKGAYEAMLVMCDELRDMESSGHTQLNYPRCMAIVSGRLFTMSEVMGKTNGARKYFVESAKYYTEERIAHKLPSKHYLPEDIRENIKNEDAAGPVFWRKHGTK